MKLKLNFNDAVKSMDKYTIYCTVEQTKKALELGAEISFDTCYSSIGIEQAISGRDKDEYTLVYNPHRHDDYLCKVFTIPTAEQMIGWLEEQGLAIDIIRDNTCYRASVWRNELLDDGWDFYKENEVEKFSRKEATLTAIDAALDYLIKNKK